MGFLLATIVPFTAVLRIVAPVSLLLKCLLSTVLITVSRYIFHVTKIFSFQHTNVSVPGVVTPEC